MCELAGVFARLEGIKGVVEPSETNDIEGGAREPGENFDICLTRVRRGGYLLQ